MREKKGQAGTVRIYSVVTNTVQEVERVIKTDAEWKEILTAEQFRIMRQKGTEPPVPGKCEIPEDGGVYQCAGCGTDLFAVSTEFNSGTGWPSFWEPVSDYNIRLETDHSLTMERVEVLCARCDAHLGHVFNDGPQPTGKRYCINGVALRFVPLDSLKNEKATFAAGCFWGVEEVFRNLKGVISTRVGYTGGSFTNPTYEEVCSDTTGHAEAVEIEFNPGGISYTDLLEVFWSMHDPTTPNKQGPDLGSQYRSAIFYHNGAQKKEALASKERLEQAGKYKNPIVTEIVPAGEFYAAEEYHQRYFQKRGIKPQCHIPVK